MTPVYQSLHIRGMDGAVVGRFVDSNVTNMVARELFDRVITIQAKITDQTMIVCKVAIQ